MRALRQSFSLRARALACLATALLLLPQAAAAQTAPSPPPPPAAPGAPPDFKLFRYDEDYRYLADPSAPRDYWDPMKHIVLDRDYPIYLSVGGELRERFEYYSAPDFGLFGAKPNGYLLQRFLINSDLHVGDGFRAFVQLGSYFAFGKDFAAPPYEDQLDVQQAFVDFRVPLAPEIGLAPILRAGRQEMAFGSQRIVAIRDAPNVRRAFDGFRLHAEMGNFRIDALAVRPVLNRLGVFDDPSNTNQALWGLYATAMFAPGRGLDLYYLGYDNARSAFAGSAGQETRQSIGLRLFGVAGGWDWDWEALWQFGSFANRQILAWTVSSNTGYTFRETPWSPRLGLKADIASGDSTPGGRTVGTFNALYPKLAYFNAAALVAPANVMDLQPSLAIRPFRNVAVTLGWDFLWRQTTQDAIYVEPFVAVPGTAGQGSSYIGNQIALDIAWQIDRHILLEASYVHFTAGDTLRSAGGRDVDFVAVAATYRF
mgnify:FL=1